MIFLYIQISENIIHTILRFLKFALLSGKSNKIVNRLSGFGLSNNIVGFGLVQQYCTNTRRIWTYHQESSIGASWLLAFGRRILSGLKSRRRTGVGKRVLDCCTRRPRCNGAAAAAERRRGQRGRSGDEAPLRVPDTGPRR